MALLAGVLASHVELASAASMVTGVYEDGGGKGGGGELVEPIEKEPTAHGVGLVLAAGQKSPGVQSLHVLWPASS